LNKLYNDKFSDFNKKLEFLEEEKKKKPKMMVACNTGGAGK